MKKLFEEEYSKIDLARCHECGQDEIALEEFVCSSAGRPATSATAAVNIRVVLGREPR